MTEEEVLCETYRLLAKGWCQGASARSADGSYVAVTDPNAACFCLTGAIRRVCNPDLPDNYPLFVAVANTILSVVYRDGARVEADHPSNMLAVWNDIPQRTQARVLEVVAEARDMAQRLGR